MDVTTREAGSHPCLLSYGGTDASDLPLVLIVGREPNGTGPVSLSWGHYDFQKRLDGTSRAGSPFWDCAYGLLGTASSPSIDTKSFKVVAAARGVSPILFADALPQGIDNAVRDKTSLRLAIPAATIADHVAGVFSHASFIDRVKLVLLSGFDDSLARSGALYEAESQRRGIAVQRVPFFAGQNVPRIRKEVSESSWSILRSIAANLAARPSKAPA